MLTTTPNPRTMRRRSCDTVRRVVPFRQRVRQDDSRGLRRAWRRARADDRGITVESVIIGVLLIAAVATIAVFAIQWATNLGQTTVARSNLEVAATAAATQHAASLSGTFDTARIENIVPELDFVAVTDHASIVAALGDDGTLQAGQVAWVLGTDYMDFQSGTSPYIADEDVIWLFTRGDNGDSYCAIVVAAARGADMTALGTWFAGYRAGTADPLAGARTICHADPGTDHDTVDDLLGAAGATRLSRIMPDFS